jgi:hypothetical protein
MNDLDLVRELRPEIALPEVDELGVARDLLVSAISAERANGVAAAHGHASAHPAATLPGAARPGAAQPPRPRWRFPAGGPRARASWQARRLALTGGVVAVAAAVAAAALVVLPGRGAPPASGHAASPSGSQRATVPAATGRATAPSVTAPVPAGVSVAAAHLLRRAALAALRLPAGAPRPDQFVYSDNRSPGGQNIQLWLSANGSRKGLSLGAGIKRFVIKPCTVAQAQARRCVAEAGFYPGMPASPRGLLAYLNKVGVTNVLARLGRRDQPHPQADTQDGPAGSPGWVDNDIAKGIFYLMGTTYLLPGQRAALFELMAQTPGFKVVQGVRDAIGRTGVGVEWPFMGAKAGEIILAPRTYAYLGVRTFPAPGFHGPGAHAYDGEALITMAVVDKAGQLP